MYYNHLRKHLSNSNNSLPFFTFHSEVGNLLNTLLTDHIKNKENEGDSEVFYKPNIDIYETKSNYNIIADLSGVEQKDIEISLEKNILTIAGEKKRKESEEEKILHKSEIKYGKFKRAIEFPDKANPEGITAEYKEGVLNIKIPKLTVTEVKKIEIKPA